LKGRKKKERKKEKRKGGERKKNMTKPVRIGIPRPGLLPNANLHFIFVCNGMSCDFPAHI
jgi:hypothetical protein